MNHSFTDVYVVLRLVMVCQSACMIKFLFTGVDVADKSPCSSTCYMVIPMNTLNVALEVESFAVSVIAAIEWAREYTSGLLLDLL